MAIAVASACNGKPFGLPPTRPRALAAVRPAFVRSRISSRSNSASEAFLVLRALQGGIPVALVPLVMVAMNVIYALSAYPFGKLSDRMSHDKLLALGLVVLIAADLVLATSSHWSIVLAGVTLWGVHMGITQGLLATMVADTTPADLRGTAYGFFNLVSGFAMLVASAVAGLLWDRLGAPVTFCAGALFRLIALVGLAWRPGTRSAKL